jgi:hypothetical protein
MDPILAFAKNPGALIPVNRSKLALKSEKTLWIYPQQCSQDNTQRRNKIGLNNSA